MNGVFSNDEAVALNANGYKLHHLWTGKKAYVGGRGGLGANLHLNDHVGINLELNTNMLSDKFNSKKAVMLTGSSMPWQVLLLLLVKVIKRQCLSTMTWSK